MREYGRVIIDNDFGIQSLALIITIVLLSYVQILCEPVLYTLKTVTVVKISKCDATISEL